LDCTCAPAERGASRVASWSERALFNGPYGVSQGNSVAVSGDGNTAIVGGPATKAAPGTVGVHAHGRRCGASRAANWSGPVLSMRLGGYVVYQGSSVALSADGNTAIVGGPGDNGQCRSGRGRTSTLWRRVESAGRQHWSRPGASIPARFMVRSKGPLWRYQPTGNNGASCGVALGTTTLPEQRGCTRARAACGPQQGAKLGRRRGGVHSTLQGSSVAISGDGNTAIVGGRPVPPVAGKSCWVSHALGRNLDPAGRRTDRERTGVSGSALQGSSRSAVRGTGTRPSWEGPTILHRVIITLQEQPGCSRAQARVEPTGWQTGRNGRRFRRKSGQLCGAVWGRECGNCRRAYRQRQRRSSVGVCGCPPPLQALSSPQGALMNGAKLPARDRARDLDYHPRRGPIRDYANLEQLGFFGEQPAKRSWTVSALP